MSRLITLLLMHQNGYDVGKYISIEAEIEKTKEAYYDALRASSWNGGHSDYEPFMLYHLGIIKACYTELNQRFVMLSSSRGGLESVRACFEDRIEPISKRQIMETCPTISQKTVERALLTLQQEGFIEKVGAGPATKYRKTW